MYIKEISPRIKYVGVNDRTTFIFESMWPIPDGVSYNSYLIKGAEKTALVDTVEFGHSRDFICALQEPQGPKTIDYLVVNHMEPDHSGSIRRVIELFPDIRIICNKISRKMIQGFYHIDDPGRFIETKDGDEISLGDRTLKFFHTPNVHWPETMMTYCPEEKALFSGDGFGTFGALNGGIIDTELTPGAYLEEMYRYYACIVGKYGRFVVNALNKLNGLPIDYICSTHGPVWHRHVAEAMEITRRLGNYEPEDGVTIIYGSMYGNTAELAELFASELASKGVRNIRIHNAAKADMSRMISDAFRYKGLIVGAPTYSNTVFPPVRAFVEAMQTREIRNKVIATFGNCAWAPFAAKSLKEAFSEMNLEDAGNVAMLLAPDSDVRKRVAEAAENFYNLYSQND